MSQSNPEKVKPSRGNLFRFVLAVSGLITLTLSGCVTHEDPYVDGTVNITGSSQTGGEGSFKLEIGRGTDPETWTDLGVVLTEDGSVDLEESLMASWNTRMVNDGEYTVRLTVTDSDGVRSEDRIYLNVDNVPPQPTKPCPSWTSPSLIQGSNGIDIGLSGQQYGSNMNCSVDLACPAGMNIGIYSEGDTEYGYDYLYLGSLTSASGEWSGYVFSSGNPVELRFTSDETKDGVDGYGGFNVTGAICTPYCFSYSGDYRYNYISGVSLNTGSTSSAGSIYSNNQPETFTTLVAGVSYTLGASVTTAGNYEQHVTAWIDYNLDNDLEDPGEEIEVGVRNVSGTYTFTKTFTVPSNAVPGKALLRVTDRYLEDPLPCDLFVYGEVEDYTVLINNPSITNCTLAGDYSPCGEVSDKEVADYVIEWSQGGADLSDVLALIEAWNGG